MARMLGERKLQWAKDWQGKRCDGNYIDGEDNQMEHRQFGLLKNHMFQGGLKMTKEII